MPRYVTFFRFAEALRTLTEVADVFFFGGLPIGSSPAGMSQFGCLQLGQKVGLPPTRFTHS